MNEVRYSQRASRDEVELIGHIALQDRGVAAVVARAIGDAVTRLAIDPRLGTATSVRGLLRYPIRRYGVTLFVRHRPRKRVLEVVRVLRGKRVKSLSKMP